MKGNIIWSVFVELIFCGKFFLVWNVLKKVKINFIYVNIYFESKEVNVMF